MAYYAGNRSLYYIDIQVFGEKSMKHSCRCCLVPFGGFCPFSCPFYLEYHHAVVSEVSKVRPRFESPLRRRNVGKYFPKEVNLVTNLFHKQHVYHLKSVNIQQSFRLSRHATLYREGSINVNSNLH